MIQIDYMKILISQTTWRIIKLTSVINLKTNVYEQDHKNIYSTITYHNIRIYNNRL